MSSELLRCRCRRAGAGKDDERSSVDDYGLAGRDGAREMKTAIGRVRQLPGRLGADVLRGRYWSFEFAVARRYRSAPSTGPANPGPYAGSNARLLQMTWGVWNARGPRDAGPRFKRSRRCGPAFQGARNGQDGAVDRRPEILGAVDRRTGTQQLIAEQDADGQHEFVDLHTAVAIAITDAGRLRMRGDGGTGEQQQQYRRPRKRCHFGSHARVVRVFSGGRNRSFRIGGMRGCCRRLFACTQSVGRRQRAARCGTTYTTL